MQALRVSTYLWAQSATKHCKPGYLIVLMGHGAAKTRFLARSDSTGSQPLSTMSWPAQALSRRWVPRGDGETVGHCAKPGVED